MGTLRHNPVRSISGSLFGSHAIWDDGNCCAHVSIVRTVSSDVTRKNGDCFLLTIYWPITESFIYHVRFIESSWNTGFLA